MRAEEEAKRQALKTEAETKRLTEGGARGQATGERSRSET